MVDRQDEARHVLQAIWSADGEPDAALDADCSPTKVCRNMKGVTFDGYGDDGTDPADAWREQLRREGKYDPSAGTLRDLVAGSDR